MRRGNYLYPREVFFRKLNQSPLPLGVQVRIDLVYQDNCWFEIGAN